MFEIKGKKNTAVCFASLVESEAIEQIRRMCDYDFTEGSRICIMPDVHAGKGCTIGTTMTVTDKAVPNVVGVDIGCGMYTAVLLGFFGKAKEILLFFSLSRYSELNHT
ncbi:RtcB family protein [Ruminobacter amylophilus]|uniref:RtcB family protein n=1 Tax=Ruminobacter amylophilus TaxID=867 RepID=UPI003864E9E6